MIKNLDLWTEMYESTLDEGTFVGEYRKPIDVINKIKSEIDPSSVMKIVIGSDIYDIKDIYSIEDDNTSTYLCIEAEEKKTK